jgi:hypothetical protein
MPINNILFRFREEKNLLREIIEADNEKICTYQTMLLKNDESREVEVHESKELDFYRIQEHLRQGGSVFITGKPSQKLPMPILKSRRPRKRKAVRTVTAFYFDHV